MAFVIKTGKTLRNHWKKSTFAGLAIAYGISYTKNYIATQNLMTEYCEKAARYGNQTIPVTQNPRNITVILNPNANKRKATDEFEKYCAPLLHLAGICVDIVKTEHEGHAKTLMETLNSGPEAIVVAGGDGTLSEVVTGLMRRTNETANGIVPIGVLPIGKSNTLAKIFFSGEKVKSLVDATMAVIEEVTKPIDIMKIEILDDNESAHKPVYATAGLKWGAFRDAEVKKESYWYFGGLKKYVTYVFNGAKSSLTWNCNALINYSLPCEGCSNCYKSSPQASSKWFQKFVKKENNDQEKYLAINNPDCATRHEKNISTTDLALFTSNAIPSSISSNYSPKISKFKLFIGPENVNYVQFVKQGWKSENGESREVEEVIDAKMIEMIPENLNMKKESWFSIDNENYEVKPIRITLLPKMINLYCKKENVS